MSCGAECLFEMMEFRNIDRLRGNPGYVSKPKNYDSKMNEKYNVMKKQGYENALDKSYFEMPTKISDYAVIPIYQVVPIADLTKKAARVQREKPALKADMNEIDNLEALILAAKEMEQERWIQ